MKCELDLSEIFSCFLPLFFLPFPSSSEEKEHHGVSSPGNSTHHHPLPYLFFSYKKTREADMKGDFLLPPPTTS